MTCVCSIFSQILQLIPRVESARVAFGLILAYRRLELMRVNMEYSSSVWLVDERSVAELARSRRVSEQQPPYAASETVVNARNGCMLSTARKAPYSFRSLLGSQGAKE